jgi:glycosyltransferase involved in cell wall biosynthesis
MPTRRDEMFGMVAAEALSSGTPIVCSNLGGLPEVVPPTAGVLVPPGDTDALADALIALCSDRDGRRRMARRAPQAAQRYDWSSVAEQAESLYREVLGA